jgi:hypothetical protein
MASLPYLPQPDVAAIQASAVTAVKNSTVGWGLIAQPALALATDLLDAAGQKNSNFALSLTGEYQFYSEVF